MFHSQSSSKSCTLLAVLCGKFLYTREGENRSHRASYPFPRLASSGRLEVHILTNPSLDRFREVQKSVEPNFLYFQGEQFENEERIGSVVWAGVDLSEPTSFSTLIGPSLPTTVYLEVPESEKVAEALHSKGIPYIIYWRNGFSSYMASHFRQALLSVVQSSCSHTWDAFQLAYASFRLHCSQSTIDLPENNQKINSKLGPCILGDAPKFNIQLLEKVPGGEVEEEGYSSDDNPTIKIYDDGVDMKFLICGFPCTLDACLLGSLEDGVNALLNIEIRGSKLHNRVSATPPPLQAGAIARGVITMRCDLTTCSLAHISLLVSGSARTCFNDQLLESHIKKELIENSQLVHMLSDCEEKPRNFSEPRKSSSVACGASVFEVCMKVPTWASQVLKQLAPEISYHSLASLGVASIQGSPIASFEEDDSERLLFFCSRQEDRPIQFVISHSFPIWLRPPTPSRKRSTSHQEKTDSYGMLDENVHYGVGGRRAPLVPTRQKSKFATMMKPIPRLQQHKMFPFSGMCDHGVYDAVRVKPNLPAVQSRRHMPQAHVTRRKAASTTFQAQQIISLNPLPLKKHGCNRSPIQTCAKEEFLRDVMEFLILRGHSRLVPQGGISEFPDAILNAKRLDLYNLYREVVTRGGFHVGNGINWKGQVFSKMRNHTATNRMTGVGNTLKRHYETYLLEYELAHDDVDGECCLLCHSAPGDWVNCGLCGEWAHLGCDRRQGLGAFKDYAKTDGLDYVCPHCSLTNHKKKSTKVANGFPQRLV